jgi:pimeloyl-[acyl-carrier protein] methyl ester esterase
MGLNIQSNGSGPDLVLLHGWGMNASLWDDVAAGLARQFRVHSVDLPGHGASGTCKPYELDVVTASLAAALPPHAIVCGWSWGGQVALNWALTRPGQVKRLVLIASTPRFVRGPAWDCGVDSSAYDDFARDLAHDWQSALRRFNELQAHGDMQRRAVSRRLRERILAHGEPLPAALAAGLRILKETDLRANLAHIAQPVLILHGARDAVVPLAAGEYLQRALPRATLDVFADTGHAPLIAEPQRTMRSIVEFCRGS